MRGNAKMEHRAWLLGWFGGWSCALVQFVKLMQADELDEYLSRLLHKVRQIMSACVGGIASSFILA